MRLITCHITIRFTPKSRFNIRSIHCTIIGITIIQAKLSPCRYTFPDIHIHEDVTYNFHIMINIILTHSHQTNRICYIIQSCRAGPITINIIDRNNRRHLQSNPRLILIFILQIGNSQILTNCHPIFNQLIFRICAYRISLEKRINLSTLVIRITQRKQRFKTIRPT